MAQTKFFTRKSDNLEDYKNNFLRALQKVKIVKLFESEVIEFLENWIKSQKSYIPREDVDNFLENMNFLFKHEDFYKLFLAEKKKLDKKNILEYSFNLISKLDDLKKDFEKKLLEKEKQEKLKKDLEKQKKEDEEKLKNLENLFNEI